MENRTADPRNTIAEPRAALTNILSDFLLQQGRDLDQWNPFVREARAIHPVAAFHSMDQPCKM